MRLLVLSLAVSLLFTQSLFAQNNFTITPEKPKPGDLVKFSYTPAGNLAGNNKPVEVYIISFQSKGQKITDIPVTRAYGKWEGQFKTDTSDNLVAVAFKIDQDFDNNSDNGYLVHLYNGDQPVQQSNYSASLVYRYYAEDYLGLKTNTDKALTYLEAEKAAYPANFNDKYLTGYLAAQLSNDKAKGTAAIQKEIELAFRAGLEDEKNLAKITSLYGLLKLPQQQAYFAKLKNEKYPKPANALSVNDYYNNFRSAAGIAAKVAVHDAFNADTALRNTAPDYKDFGNYLVRQIATAYAAQGDFKNFEAFTQKIADKMTLAGVYNAVAWNLQEKDTALDYAAGLAKQATTITKANIKKPVSTKPDMMTGKQWDESRKNIYAQYADTYAMILYKAGKYKAALPLAKDAAMVYNEGNNAELNKTYALIAEKALPAKQLKTALEGFVKNGKADASIKEMLKKAYTKEKGSETGFDDYIVFLEKEATIKLMEALKANMIGVAAPKFALKNLEGNNVSLESLKGKTLIVDFWATWCGPCKASFPAMQKLVTKYKNNPSVQFLFVDTWEQVENKEKNAKDFITANNYSFEVLMDTQNEVAAAFQKTFPGFTGIPTKFIVDKEGVTRYMAVGFEGEDQTIKEIDALLEMLK